MRSLFLHRYTDNEQIVTLLVTLEGTVLAISDKDSGILLGTLGWDNSTITGDDSFLPEDVIFEITRRLVIATTKVVPAYVELPEEEEEG